MLDVPLACVTFCTTVPGVVVVVAAVLAIARVVLPVVRHQILEGESVVGCDEVDRMERLSAIVLEEVRAAANPRCEVARFPSVPFDETSNGIPEDAVPLSPSRRPARWKLAHEVTVWPGAIPRFRDELGSRELRLLGHLPHEQRVHGDLAVPSAGERGSQVETEAVHVHFLHPVAKAVYNPVAGHGVIGTDSVSATCVVGVVTAVKNVVAFLGNSSPAVPVVLAPCTFGCVIEDHVEDHFDAHTVQLSHHGLKADDCSANPISGGESLHRNVEVDRGVAPKVAKLFAIVWILPGAGSLIELVDWQQLHCIDSEL
mmetsp:Transcript_83930/g.201301  ORF Transcript_83930/g.201301 Transcript_83930/m.201301 type:complete len:314 (+) Transcript_83930:1396-2337(+)